MGSIAGISNIERYYTALSNYISFYAEKFAVYVTVSDPTSDPPSSSTYNVTLEELNSYGNKIIGMIGGLLLTSPRSSSSSSEDSSDSSDTTPEPPASTNGIIIPMINTAFTSWFKDFNYDTAMLIAGEAWISEQEIRSSSEYKIRGISLLNACKFLNAQVIELTNRLTNLFTNLDQVKNLLDNHYNHMVSVKGSINRVINSINGLRNLYNVQIMNINANSMYASNADYISHQIYNDYYAHHAISSWSPDAGRAIDTAEEVIPEIINKQISDLNQAISKINLVANEIAPNNTIQKLNQLKADVNNQYLSSYVENFGHRIAAIISDLMAAIPEDYDYKLTDKLIEIEQFIESTVMNSASRYTVYSKFGAKYLSKLSVQSSHTSLLSNLRTAVGALDALSY